MDQSSRNPTDEQLVGHFKFDCLVQFLLGRGEHGVEFLGLDDCSGETVEDEAVERAVEQGGNKG